MLVLSRKKSESIVINDDITIMVIEIRGNKVRLGIGAPKSVPVHRREIYDAIQKEKDIATHCHNCNLLIEECECGEQVDPLGGGT